MLSNTAPFDVTGRDERALRRKRRPAGRDDAHRQALRRGVDLRRGLDVPGGGSERVRATASQLTAQPSPRLLAPGRGIQDLRLPALSGGGAIRSLILSLL